MSAPVKILVVDDEPPIRKLLRTGLDTQGYEVLQAPNGKAALELLASKPDLVILDLGLPDVDGLELLKKIRGLQNSLPIVVLSSRGDEVGKVAALDLGADDYVTKPFGMEELLARIRAALRHQLQVQGELPVFHVGDLSVDLVRRIVKKGDKEVKLSPKEYDLLRLLVQHAGKGAHPQGPVARALGRSDRYPVPARVRAPTAPQDRDGPRAATVRHDRNRRRLSAACAGVSRTLVRQRFLLTSNHNSLSASGINRSMDAARIALSHLSPQAVERGDEPMRMKVRPRRGTWLPVSRAKHPVRASFACTGAVHISVRR